MEFDAGASRSPSDQPTHNGGVLSELQPGDFVPDSPGSAAARRHAPPRAPPAMDENAENVPVPAERERHLMVVSRQGSLIESRPFNGLSYEAFCGPNKMYVAVSARRLRHVVFDTAARILLHFQNKGLQYSIDEMKDILNDDFIATVLMNAGIVNRME